MLSINKVFADKHGDIVVFQPPNKVAVVALVATVLSMVLPYGTWNFIASLISYGTIFTWAWLELFEGASLFRRALGCAVLIWLVLSKIT